MHIVRASRGVADSWTKTVTRPETPTGEPMPRFGVGRVPARWLVHNVEMGFAVHRGAPLARLRYEDLVQDAEGTVRAA